MPAKDMKAYQKEWYAKKKASGFDVAAQSKNARQLKREWYNTIMEDKFCEKCGESDNACLDWHHTDPTQKEAAVSYLLFNNSKKTILEEIKKCICLCSNCHRKLHYYNRD
jgi:hypothetical protein